MRAYPLSLQSSYLLFFGATATTHYPFRFLPTTSNLKSYHSLLTVSPRLFLYQFRPNPSNCFNSDSSVLDTNNEGDGDDDDDNVVLLEKGTEWVSGDGLCIEVEKLGRNSRRIRSKIEIDASLDAVWNVLTDYEKLADFIPGLAVSEVIEKKDNFVRLYQIGQQNLPFGLKFNAKGVLDCYEKDLEIFPTGKKRDIEFNMIEGDFQLFEGKWSIEQLNGGICEDSDSSLRKKFHTTLSYSVDVRPKLWLPVGLVEGRLCNEIKSNLSCIREAARKLIHRALHAH